MGKKKASTHGHCDTQKSTGLVVVWSPGEVWTATVAVRRDLMCACMEMRIMAALLLGDDDVR